MIPVLKLEIVVIQIILQPTIAKLQLVLKPNLKLWDTTKEIVKSMRTQISATIDKHPDFMDTLEQQGLIFSRMFFLIQATTKKPTMDSFLVFLVKLNFKNGKKWKKVTLNISSWICSSSFRMISSPQASFRQLQPVPQKSKTFLK